MKTGVSNMVSASGNSVANQFSITTNEGGCPCFYFQSYNSVIVKIKHGRAKITTTLDKNYWDYSVTTGKYRNQFLGETKKETQAKIDSGEYKLANLN